jgi:hypothetical protein
MIPKDARLKALAQKIRARPRRVGENDFVEKTRLT